MYSTFFNMLELPNKARLGYGATLQSSLHSSYSNYVLSSALANT